MRDEAQPRRSHRPGSPQGEPGRSPTWPPSRPSPPWPHTTRRSTPTPHVTTARSSATTASWPKSASTCPLLLRAAAPRRRRSAELPPQLPSTPHRLPQPASRHPYPNTSHPPDDLECLFTWVLHNHMRMRFWISRRYCRPPPLQLPTPNHVKTNLDLHDARQPPRKPAQRTTIKNRPAVRRKA